MKKYKMLMLQMFAEGGEGDYEQGGSGEGGEGNKEGENDPVSFDDFLAMDGMQSEFDRRVSKAIAKAIKNEEKKRGQGSQATTLRQMRMSEEEHKDYEDLKKRIVEMERQNNINEMMREARNILKGKNINVGDELIAMMINEDAEATKSAVDAFCDLYNESVKAGIVKALKGKTPSAGEAAGGLTKEQILAVKDRSERQRLIRENLSKFQ